MSDQTPTPVNETDVVSPVEAITALLIEAGHSNPSAWLQGLCADVFVTNDQSVQRFLINRYWRMQLISVKADTLDARYCLIDEKHVKTADWLRIFKTGVLPCIMEHNLPSLTN